MSSVGQRERATQNRIIRLFHDQLEYDYLGNQEELSDNRNIEPELLQAYLENQGYDEPLISPDDPVHQISLKKCRKQFDDFIGRLGRKHPPHRSYLQLQL